MEDIRPSVGGSIVYVWGRRGGRLSREVGGAASRVGDFVTELHFYVVEPGEDDVGTWKV